MRIFATSDMHNHIVVINKLKELIASEHFDYVVNCGDIAGKRFQSDSFLDRCREQRDHFLFFKNQFPEMIYILGNDDWVDVQDTSDKYYASEGFGLGVENQVIPEEFVGFEWTLYTPFTTNREANENKIKYELNKLNVTGNSIIIAHCPPRDYRDLTYRGQHAGSKAIKEFVNDKQPKLYLCGHIHEDFGVSSMGNTGVFNCACDPHKDVLRGWIIDTDTLKYDKVII